MLALFVLVGAWEEHGKQQHFTTTQCQVVQAMDVIHENIRTAMSHPSMLTHIFTHMFPRNGETLFYLKKNYLLKIKFEIVTYFCFILKEKKKTLNMTLKKKSLSKIESGLRIELSIRKVR